MWFVFWVCLRARVQRVCVVREKVDWGEQLFQLILEISEADLGILKSGALYIGYHGWPTKKSFGFRWSKKAKITL